MATDLSANTMSTSSDPGEPGSQGNQSAVDLAKEPSSDTTPSISQLQQKAMMSAMRADVSQNGQRETPCGDTVPERMNPGVNPQPGSTAGVDSDNQTSCLVEDHVTRFSPSLQASGGGSTDDTQVASYAAFLQATNHSIGNMMRQMNPTQPISLSSTLDSNIYTSTNQPKQNNISDSKYPVTVPNPALSSDMTLDDDEDDDEDDDDEDGDEDDEDTESGSKLGTDDVAARKRAQHAITGRGVTLAMLMADKIIQPGPSTMSIDYLGQKFTADLLEDGSIRWKEANKLFNSPSAWAIHCKKIVNPMKKSGCGWASVRYKGKKLDAYKSSWLRKKRPLAMAAMAGLGVSEEEEEDSESKPDTKRIKCDEIPNCEVTEAVPQPPAPVPPLLVKPEKKRISVKHSTLGRKSLMHDSSTLVECTPFAALGKIQPFSLSVSNTALLSMDFHCHLCSNEVIGYLGGKWDPQSQHLSIERSFACLCHYDDKTSAAEVERQIRTEMERCDLTLAGWYHSHPHTQSDPSLRDLEAQIEYQIQMKGNGESIQPCVALIISPYGQDSPGHEESDVSAIWVMAPPEHRPLDYGMPMRICYDVTEDQGIPKYLLSDLKRQSDFHQAEPGAINFSDTWHHSGTYHNKLKASLSRKLPHDQEVDKQLLDFLNTLL